MILEFEKIIEKLHALTQVDVQSHWSVFAEDFEINIDDSGNRYCCDRATSGQIFSPNEKGYLVWEAGRKVRWLVQKITVPNHLNGYTLQNLALRLCLTWWSEDAQIFVNQKFVQAGDLFDSSARILLTDAVIPGETFKIAIRLISPDHDIGALMRSHCLYESAYEAIDPGFVANELAVLHQYLTNFEPDKLEILLAEMEKIDWGYIGDRDRFHNSLQSLRQKLQPLAASLKQRCIKMMGHAHLDMAWLWEQKETYQVAKRTFTSVLNLQKDFPDLTFCHTSPALYEWIEKHHPKLFSAILAAIKAGSWELLGGMWVEPEVNLPSGESLVRQLLYGQRYTREKFGEISKVAWLTDSFGFCWQLPQILKQAGIEYFVTQKLRWNDSTEFPHELFWWQSPDGTKLLTLMSPPNITGVMDTNPITITNFAVDWEKKTGIKDVFWLPGVGDHGGGPTRDMLEVKQRWDSSPFFPKIEFTTAKQYLDSLHDSPTILPTWNDELYLELHRGIYTTHADQKYFNRRCEGLLYEAELFATLAKIINNSDYPQTAIENAWKQVLFNQFHDILPGTSIPEVFVTANQEWKEAIATGEKVLSDALEAIAESISYPDPPFPNGKPILVFNSLNWRRSQVISLQITSENWQVCDRQGNLLKSQLIPCRDVQLNTPTDGMKTLLFLAENIPSIGYRLFWLIPFIRHPSSVRKQKTENKEEYVLENNILRVEVDPKTGELDRVFDKGNQREVLQGKGNQLQAFKEERQYWDAWNIDPNYQQNQLPSPQLESIEWLDCGEVRSRLRVVRKINHSRFSQDYILDLNSPYLKIETHVDWQETHVLIKAAFPLNLEADFATYEIPCGVISRTTKPKTDAEKAQWEVPALKWADLGDNDYGVSLLNDCKYGYDSSPNCLRLTLLKSPVWPDPQADRGQHHFTYCLYPHRDSWQVAATVRKGYELNLPLIVREWENKEKPNQNPKLFSEGSLLNLSAKNLILMALKPSEDDLETYILRCYECQGKDAQIEMKGELNWAIASSTNLLEIPQSDRDITSISPWQIKTVTIRI
ncbi:MULTISPECIES: alpha-mannosidase [Spirulina sp. CCY15215]|uniref:alpha-mannosidase n=1 Tax=Spirulina sp. CCY15215 TaxID=2767591 RepID=UPI0019517986|nr:alpha-mannosidase [Spirulina major]